MKLIQLRFIRLSRVHYHFHNGLFHDGDMREFVLLCAGCESAPVIGDQPDAYPVCHSRRMNGNGRRRGRRFSRGPFFESTRLVGADREGASGCGDFAWASVCARSARTAARGGERMQRPL
jgi:hypothetical protein